MGQSWFRLALTHMGKACGTVALGRHDEASGRAGKAEGLPWVCLRGATGGLALIHLSYSGSQISAEKHRGGVTPRPIVWTDTERFDYTGAGAVRCTVPVGNGGRLQMFFAKVGTLLAWVGFIIGLLMTGIGFYVASIPDADMRLAATRRYIGSGSSGDAIDRGIVVVVVSVGLGVLCKLAKRR